jgi:hypothetical protein
MTINQTGIVKSTSDIKKIEELLHGIIGELCWETYMSYGGELCLEIGAKEPPRLTGIEMGVWSLGVRESDWILSLAGEQIVTSDDEESLIKQKMIVMEGCHISGLSIEYPTLSLELMFNSEARLKIVPVRRRNSKLAHWEFFMPNSMLLDVGPGKKWYFGNDEK